MNAKLTQDDLQAIKNRADKATPGPWYRSVQHGSMYVKDYDDWTVCEMFAINDENNVAFIIKARQDIPQLVAEVERLQSVNARLINALQSINAVCDTSEDIRQNRDLLIVDEIAFDILNELEALE